jgi:hypothetical protein
MATPCRALEHLGMSALDPDTVTDVTQDAAVSAEAGGEYSGVAKALWLAPMIVAAFLVLLAVGAQLFGSYGLKSLYCAADVGDTQTSVDGRFTAHAYQLRCFGRPSTTNVQVVDHHHAWLPLEFRRDDAFCTSRCYGSAKSRASLLSIRVKWSDERTLVVTGVDRDATWGHTTVDVPWSRTYRMRYLF